MCSLILWFHSYSSHDSRAIEAEKQIERERAAFAEQQIIAEQEMVGLVFVTGK